MEIEVPQIIKVFYRAPLDKMGVMDFFEIKSVPSEDPEKIMASIYRQVCSHMKIYPEKEFAIRNVSKRKKIICIRVR